MRRRLWALSAAILLTGIAGVVSSVAVILDPAMDEPEQADAVILLSGDLGQRLPLALGLMQRGVSKTLVVDGLPDLPQTKQLCSSAGDFEVVCLDPRPDSTKTEAAAAGALAEERRWQHVVVVTDEVHVTRARLLFERCMKGRVSVVGAELPKNYQLTWRAVAHEWIGSLAAITVDRRC